MSEIEPASNDLVTDLYNKHANTKAYDRPLYGWHILRLIARLEMAEKERDDIQYDAERAAKTMTELATENEKLRNESRRTKYPCPRCGASRDGETDCDACQWPHRLRH